MNLKEIGTEGVDSIRLAQGTDQWQRSVVYLVKDIRGT